MIDELTLEVSHKCNLKCMHCSSRRFDCNLHFGDVTKLVNKYKPSIIRWSGGEPFIYLTSDYLTINTQEIKNVVSTNGTFKNSIYKYYNLIDEIRISVYGFREFHDGVTGVSGTFDKVIDTLESFSINTDFKNKFVITSPYWNLNQIQQVEDISNRFDLKCRITSLVPPVYNNKIIGNICSHVYNNKIIGNTCSVGVGKCNYNKKILIQPNGSIVHCATEKRGFGCKFKEL